jgi:hypothetical protein
MKLTKSQLKQIIKEELTTVTEETAAGRYRRLGTWGDVEPKDMYAPNEATELRLLYNDFVDQLSADITPMMTELDQQIRDKIEQIEIRLNELAK